MPIENVCLKSLPRHEAMNSKSDMPRPKSDRRSKLGNNVTYSALNVLVINTIVNVYGVVKFCKPPAKTQGADYLMVISIVDQSLHEGWKKLKCNLFEREAAKLPSVDVGQIVRFHRLRISQFCGELQGQSGPGFSWLIFDPRPTEIDEIKPLSASTFTYTFTDTDRQTIKNLHQWINSKYSAVDDSQKYITLSKISPALYFDLVCQVVAVYVIEEGVCYLVRVWDGTKPAYPIREINTVNAIQGDTNKELMEQASGMIYDICLYDDHFLDAYTNIKPGNFLQLINLHAVKYTGQGDRKGFSTFPTVELSLHRGGRAYNRGFTVLNEDCDQVRNLKRILAEAGAHTVEQNTTIDSLSAGNSMVCGNNEGDIIVSQQDSTDESSIMFSCDNVSLDTLSPSASQNSSSNRCMLQTASVILYHHHIAPTKIKDILSHSVPYKFRLHAKVVDFEPKPSSVGNFLRMYCPKCRETFEMDSSNCSKCTDNRSSDVEQNIDNEKLEVIYMMRFLLRDNTGWIIANIWRNDAVKFFRDLNPQDISCSPAKLKEVQEDLEHICPNSDYSEKPWLECCIKSYTGVKQTCFQIFDTCLT